ncbi:hypothetical protein DFH09DRAFT_1080105 [Mycena vulgaris]|nr:hypothetical protein DFH09DRAFT_1080105 [Mycena vulgaris]
MGEPNMKIFQGDREDRQPVLEAAECKSEEDVSPWSLRGLKLRRHEMGDNAAVDEDGSLDLGTEPSRGRFLEFSRATKESCWTTIVQFLADDAAPACGFIGEGSLADKKG